MPASPWTPAPAYVVDVFLWSLSGLAIPTDSELLTAAVDALHAVQALNEVPLHPDKGELLAQWSGPQVHWGAGAS